MSSNVYRKSGRAEPGPDTPSEIAQRAESPTTAVVGFAFAFVVTGAILGAMSNHFEAAMAVAVGASVLVGLALRMVADNGFVVTVTDRIVTVRRGRRRGRLVFRVPFDDIATVALETVAGGAQVFLLGPQFGMGEPTSGAPSDEARVVCHLRTGTPAPLGDRFGPVSEAEEWRDQIRDLLRAHGWREGHHVAPRDEDGDTS